MAVTPQLLAMEPKDLTDDQLREFLVHKVFASLTPVPNRGDYDVVDAYWFGGRLVSEQSSRSPYRPANAESNEWMNDNLSFEQQQASILYHQKRERQLTDPESYGPYYIEYLTRIGQFGRRLSDYDLWQLSRSWGTGNLRIPKDFGWDGTKATYNAIPRGLTYQVQSPCSQQTLYFDNRIDYLLYLYGGVCGIQYFEEVNMTLPCAFSGPWGRVIPDDAENVLKYYPMAKLCV